MTNYRKQRQLMVEQQLKARDITDLNVLEAMSKIPREEFIPDTKKQNAYADHPLSIGHMQTISQPYIVALMCQLLELKGNEKVLDIGTGSGYEAAVLSYLAKEVITIEVIPKLAQSAQQTLQKLGYDNIKVIVDDGRNGAPDYAPFDAIKSAATSNQVPLAWKRQLKIGGRIVLPLKENSHQNLIRLTKKETEFQKENFGGVAFVPLIEK
jgi:protein-L-isoaspartate(D-aspartate) O-methyltransferase